MRSSFQRLIFCDIEVAGFRPERHPIIQIAGLAVDENLEILEAFEAKVQFDRRRAAPRSLRKNHFDSATWLRDALPAEVAARGFADFLRRHAAVEVTTAQGRSYRLAQIVAHNSAFDAPFLEAWYRKLRLFFPANRLALCTMQRAMWYFADRSHLAPPANFKLATLCQHFGVPFHAADAHDAFGDARATLGLYRAMRTSASSSDDTTVCPTITRVATVGHDSTASQCPANR